MTSKKHKKHADIARPAYGLFGRNEWAITGAPCAVIKELANTVLGALYPLYRGAYADAEHASHEQAPAGKDGLNAGAIITYTDKNGYHQVTDRTPFNSFRYRQLFGHADLVLVNGNHFEAAAQVLILDETKKASLQKHLSQLTNIQLLLLGTGVSDVYDFIKEALPGWSQLPVYRLEETGNIIAFFKQRLEQSAPVLNGLVLAGGKSVRMGGNDKGRMDWHGNEQRYYVADMLKSYCREVYISCRPEQQQEIDAARPTLPDTFTGLGPYGALLSAFRAQPDAAWLVVACDMPLLDRAALDYLLERRHRSAIATAYTSPYDGLPEPLITIWEPKSYPVLLSLLSQGYSCPRKALINFDTALLTAPNPDVLQNVNTPEDMEKIKEKLAAI